MAVNKFGSQVDGRFSPEIGQYYYMVDSNFRTGAQGWSRADGTGPLDLWQARQPHGDTRVFYTPETGNQGTTYATQAAAIQAGIDAQIDFRGDTLFFTPGLYTPATALVFNVADARYMGPEVRAARAARATITDAIGDHSFADAADRNEIAYLRLVPLTAQNIFTNVSGADFGHMHHLFYDATGVAASVETKLFTTVATSTGWTIEDCEFEVDAAQGEIITFVSCNQWILRRCNFIVEGATITWVTCLFFETTASKGCSVEYCHFGSGGGVNGLITNEVTGIAGGSQVRFMYCTVNGTSTPTVGNFETGFDATVGIEMVECYQTGDASGQGGTLITLT
jgi:hypothetical protein